MTKLKAHGARSALGAASMLALVACGSGAATIRAGSNKQAGAAPSKTSSLSYDQQKQRNVEIPSPPPGAARPSPAPNVTSTSCPVEIGSHELGIHPNNNDISVSKHQARVFKDITDLMEARNGRSLYYLTSGLAVNGVDGEISVLRTNFDPCADGLSGPSDDRILPGGHGAITVDGIGAIKSNGRQELHFRNADGTQGAFDFTTLTFTGSP